MNSSSVLHNTILLLLLGVVLLPIYVVFHILLITFAIYRNAVGIYLSFKHGKEIDFLSGTDAIYEISVGKNQPFTQCLVKLQGKSDLNWIKNKVFDLMKSDYKNYSHFFKYVKYSCGYFYWQEEENFKMEDHICLMNCDPPSNDKEVNRLCAKIVNEYVQENEKSPWMIYVFPLSKDFPQLSKHPHYIIKIMYHHTLTDALGFSKLFAAFFPTTNNEVKLPLPNKKTNTTFGSKSTKYRNMILRNIELLKTILFTQEDTSLIPSPLMGVRIISSSSVITVDRLKKIQNVTGYPINDIILSCLVGAVKKHFPQAKNIKCTIPISVRKPSDRFFENRLSYTTFTFPLNAISLVDRLKNTAKQMTILKKPAIKLVGFKFQNMICNKIPLVLSRPLIRRIAFSINFSSLTIPALADNKEKLFPFLGYPTLASRYGMGFLVLNQGDLIMCTAAADKSVISTEESLNGILQDCIDEIGLLEDCLNKI